MLDPETTEHTDLRSGRSPWRADAARLPPPAIEASRRCEVLVVGAGITGSLVAEHLASQGREVCIIDREPAGFGSTAASTAMLQWEIDCSLSELSAFYGFERAAALYRRSLGAVTGLKELVALRGIDCLFRPRPSLYLAGSEQGAAELLAEHRLRERAGLPGSFLDHRALLAEFGIDRAAAIVAPGSADADPLLLAHGLLDRAVSQASGAAVLRTGDALAYQCTVDGVLVGLANGLEIQAGWVVLATGYVMPDMLSSPLHRTVSSWALATPRHQPEHLWRDGALLWEAADPYLYARTTVDGRIVAGGEDDAAVLDSTEREALSASKAATLLGKLKALWPQADATLAHLWSGVFGETEDGLPLIGEVPGSPRIYAAYGYGGNGITFSFLASRMIARMIAGDREPWFADVAIDRNGPS